MMSFKSPNLLTLSRRHSKTFAAVAAALSLIAIATAPAYAQPKIQLVDRVIAVVNDDVITRFDLNEQKRAVTAQLKRQGVTMPPDAELEAQVLERFITEKVQLQYARENGIRADDETVNAAMLRIAADNKMAMPKFIETLKADGLTIEKFREELKNEIILARLRDREVESRVVVSDSEIENFLAISKLQGVNQAEYQLAHILVLVPEQATPEQIDSKKKRAEEALKQLKVGTTFGQVAAVFSDASDATQGGSIGWRPADRLPAIYADAANKLDKNETSEILRSPNGFHILRVLDKRSGAQKTVVEQNKVRHILVRVNDLVSESEAISKIERYKDRIAGGAKFEDIAKLNSEDGSAPKGGELGWISPGDTAPEFEAAIQKAAINSLIGPVRSQFGMHLIQVTERRSQDVTADRTKTSARQTLRERKADEAYQTWVRELRDRATVEVKLNDI